MESLSYMRPFRRRFLTPPGNARLDKIDLSFCGKPLMDARDLVLRVSLQLFSWRFVPLTRALFFLEPLV